MGMVAHTCNPNTWKDEAEGLQVPRQHLLHNNTLSPPSKKEEEVINWIKYLWQLQLELEIGYFVGVVKYNAFFIYVK